MKSGQFANKCKIYVKILSTNQIIVNEVPITVILDNLDNIVYSIQIVLPFDINENVMGYYDSKTKKINFLGKVTFEILNKFIQVDGIGEIDIDDCNSIDFKISGNFNNEFAIAGNNKLNLIK